MATLRAYLFLLCVLTLIGCGFTLRGTDSVAMPINALQLQTAPGDDLDRLLVENLRRSGVRVLEPGEEIDQTYLLQLSPEQFDQRAIASAGRARGAQYEVTLSTTAVLVLRGEVVAGPETLSVQRRHDEDTSNISGSAQALEILRTEMRLDLANQILRRLQVVDPP